MATRDDYPERCVHTYMDPWAVPYFARYARKHKNKSAAARQLLYEALAGYDKRFKRKHEAMKMLQGS